MFLAGVIAVIVAYFAFPTADSFLWPVVAFSMPVGVMIGVRRFRPARRMPWYLLAIGLGFYALGDTLWIVDGGGGAFGLGDIAYDLGYPIVALGCLFLVKGDRRTSFLALVDALVGAFGLAVIVWDVVLSKGLEGAGLSFSTLANASYPVLDLLVLALIVRVAMSGRTTEPAFWLMLLGFSLLLATDLAYSWLEQSVVDPSGPLLDLGYLAGYVAIVAGAVHPSMARLTERRAPDAALSPVRVLWLGIPLFTVPILMLVAARNHPVDVAVQAVGALAMAALVLTRIVFSARDQNRAHREARRAEIEYRTVFEGSPVAVLKVAVGGKILEVNPAAERLFGYPDGLVDRSIRDLYLIDAAGMSEIVSSVEALRAEPADSHAIWEVRVRRGDGSSFLSAMNTSFVKGIGADPAFGITTVEDVTRRRAEEEHLRFRALHDPLTGLPNRDLLAESLLRSLARARRAGTEVAVLFLDLDGFKEVNDRFGHAAGDELLRTLAQRLDAALRGGDIVARLGGDEFVIVVEDVRSADQAEAAADRFLREIRCPIVLGGDLVSLDASIGMVLAPGEPADTVDDVLRRADSAMYEAKRAGRGTWRRFETVGADPA